MFLIHITDKLETHQGFPWQFHGTKRWVLPTMFGSYGETIGLFWLAMPWSGMNLQSMVPWAYKTDTDPSLVTDMAKEMFLLICANMCLTYHIIM